MKDTYQTQFNVFYNISTMEFSHLQFSTRQHFSKLSGVMFSSNMKPSLLNKNLVSEYFLIYAILFSCIQSSIALNHNISQGIDDHIHLISDIQNLFKIRSVCMVYTDYLDNIFESTLMLNFLKRFQKMRTLPLAIKLTDLSEKYTVFSISSWQLVVVSIWSEEDLQSFEDFAKTHILALHLWLIIFQKPSTAKVEEFCEKPHGNRFSLKFNTRMLVKCYKSSQIREWYSTGERKETLVYDLMEWTPETGLVLKSDQTVYQRRRDFGGKQLKLSAIKDYVKLPIIKGNSIENADIHQITVFEILRYLNFTIKLTAHDSYGYLNTTENRWTGILGEIEAGNIDMSLSGIEITRNRANTFDYSWPVRLLRNFIYFKDPDLKKIKWSAYIKAFDYDVLITLAVTSFLSTIIILFIKIKIHNKKYAKKNDLIEIILDVWGIYCQQGISDFPKPTSLRITVILLLISNLILSAAYSAFVISFLTNFTESLPFYSFEEFVKDGSYGLLLLKSTSDEEKFNVTKDPFLTTVKPLIRNRQEFPIHYGEGFQQLCTRKSKLGFYVKDDKYHYVTQNVSCKLLSIKADGMRFDSIILIKNSPFKYLLSYYIQRFKENGILSRIKKRNEQKKKSLETQFHSVGLSEFTPVLIIFLCGILLSLLVLVSEQFHYRYKMHRYIPNPLTIRR